MSIKIQEIQVNWTSQVQSLCYILSQWHREQWEDYLKNFPHVQASIDTGERRIKGWGMFAEEVFHRLLTLPQAIPYDQLRPEVLWASELHRLIEGSVDFSDMQLACRNNKLAAGAGTYRLIELALDALPKPPKNFQPPATLQAWEAEYIKVQSGITALVATQKQLQASLQAETDCDRQQALQQQLDQMAFDLQELQSQLRQIGRQMGRANQVAQAYAEQIGQQMANALVKAVQASLEAVQTFLGSMNAFGWGEGMGMLNIPGNSAEKEKVAQRLSQDQRFRAIAEAAGRFRAIASLRQSAKRSRQIPDEAADTSLGNNLSRLIPSEWVRLAIEGLRSLFLKDFTDESLQQVEFNGAADEGEQGPVIICLDKSESMIWNGGKKEIESTALMLALLGIAQEQRRKARVVLFDDPVRYVKDIDPATATHADLIDLADRQYDGGTNFMAPLAKALEALEDNPDLRDADVIFITDGQADVTDAFSKKWRESQKRLGFKVIALIVGTYIDTEVLAHFSDRNIYVNDLDDPQVHQVFDI
jgi:uncharacterized protein with von Willebrand factor type A (vWA) domain